MNRLVTGLYNRERLEFYRVLAVVCPSLDMLLMQNYPVKQVLGIEIYSKLTNKN